VVVEALNLSQTQDQSASLAYLFVDLETGGLTPDRHSILQVAAVLTDQNLCVQSYFMSYVKPHPSLIVTPEALSINQLKLEELEMAPDEALVAQALNNFASLTSSKPRFAGYNCKFDLQFLDELWKRQGVTAPPYKVPWLDVLDVVRIKPDFDAQLANFKLATLAQHMGIDSKSVHDALADLIITIEVAKRLKVMPYREGVMILETAKFSI
jgi:exonuclease I